MFKRSGNKKLTLATESIRVLGPRELQAAAGGGGETDDEDPGVFMIEEDVGWAGRAGTPTKGTEGAGRSRLLSSYC